MSSVSCQFCAFSGSNVFWVRKLNYMIIVTLIMVLKLCLLGRDYSSLESAKNIFYLYELLKVTVLIYP